MSMFSEEKTGFGTVSIFDVQYEDISKDPPLELPVGRYLSEAILGMYGAPEANKEKSSQSQQPEQEEQQQQQQQQPPPHLDEASPNWKRLKKAVGGDAARRVCTALAWISMGILFDIVSAETIQELREELSRSWFLLTTEVGLKGRDFVLDALPTVLVQAIYRMTVDGFPPEHAQVTKAAEKLLDKLSSIANKEVSGVAVSSHTARGLRRKFFRRPILEHPYLDLLEARRAEMRHQKLAGQKSFNSPLGFGDIENGQALDEMQLEHVLELRARSAQGGDSGIALPPLLPPELSADRYLDISNFAEEMFLRQLAEINPVAAAQEALNRSFVEVADPKAPAALDLEASDSPISPSQRRSSTIGARQRRFAAEAAERRRRDELLRSQIERPLPESVTKRTLSTSGISPMLERVAPGTQGTQGATVKVKMKAPKEQFLPQIASAPQLGGTRSPSSSSSSTAEKGTPARRKSYSVLVSGKAPKFSSLPKINEERSNQMVLPRPTLRVNHETVMKRLQTDKEGFEKQSFEHLKRDFDFVTGQKKVRLDGERLAHEEADILQEHFGLLGSRSAPALKRLGVERKVKPKATKPLQAATTQGSFGAVLTGGSLLTVGGRTGLQGLGADDSGSAAPTGASGAAGGGKRPWNELTSSEWGFRPSGG